MCVSCEDRIDDVWSKFVAWLVAVDVDDILPLHSPHSVTPRKTGKQKIHFLETGRGKLFGYTPSKITHRLKT